MDLPGNRFHALKGDRAGEYVVTVAGNVHITFRFDDQHATVINLEDDHQEGHTMKSLRNPNREPTHPDAISRENMLPALGITQARMAELLGVSRVTLSQLVHEHPALSGETA